MMQEVDVRISALLDAVEGLHQELQVTPYGVPKRLMIYCDLLLCYREIFRLLEEGSYLPYDAKHIRSFVSPKNAHLN